MKHKECKGYITEAARKTVLIDFLQLQLHVVELEKEVHDQCLLNGMGAEREYVLLGKVSSLERQLDHANRSIEILEKKVKDVTANRDEYWQSADALAAECKKLRDAI